MIKSFFFFSVFTLGAFALTAKTTVTSNPVADGKITVTGTSTVSITPDRLTVDISMTEYYNKLSDTDSVKVPVAEIEVEVRKALAASHVPDSLVTITSIGNSYYYYGARQDNLLLTKSLAATLTDMEQLANLAASMDIKGVTGFRLSKTDASNMDVHNRRGLTAALNKAREKARLIASNEGLSLGIPLEIMEDGPMYYDEEAVVTNVALDSGVMMAKYAAGASMDNLKKIVRRYSVRVTYQTTENSGGR